MFMLDWYVMDKFTYLAFYRCLDILSFTFRKFSRKYLVIYNHN